MPGPNLQNIYILNSEAFSIEQLTPEQIAHIEKHSDARAYTRYIANLLNTYGDELKGKIIINTDKLPHEYKSFDQYNQPLMKEFIRVS